MAWDHLTVDQDDPEKRIAELERQLAEAKAAAREEEARQSAPSQPPTPGAAPSAPETGPLIGWKGTWVSADGGGFRQIGSESAGATPSPQAVERVCELANEMAQAWQEHLRTGNDWGAEIKKRRDAFNRTIIETGMSPAQFSDIFRASSRGAAGAAAVGQAGVSAPSVDSRLAEPPRRVPPAFWLAELLPFRWWYVWILFLVGTAVGFGLISVWTKTPVAFSVLAVLTLVAIYAFQFSGTTKRVALLKWGQVATVTGTEVVSRASYYSGTTWGFAPLPVAHGWRVARPLYSGPNTKTRIRYALNGWQGELVVSGREYYEGVVLADSRKPARALCVTSFAYDLDRDESGNWIGRIRPRLMLGMGVWLILVIGWLALAGAVASAGAGVGFGAQLLHTASIAVPQGGKLSVGGSNATKKITCNDGHLTLGGNNNRFTVAGHCASLTVSGGTDNQVTVDSVDTITVNGVNTVVTYHSGSPTINKGGIDTTVQQG